MLTWNEIDHGESKMHCWLGATNAMVAIKCAILVVVHDFKIFAMKWHDERWKTQFLLI